MKQIVIEVSESGEVTIEAVGFKGNSCEQATREMERALGMKKSSKKKPEYYETNREQKHITQ